MFNDDNTKNGETTVYAKWIEEKATNYSVIYKSNYVDPTTNEVTKSPDLQTTDTAKYNVNYKIKGGNTFTAPTGYSFSKWNTKPDGNGETWAAGESKKYLKTSSTTLYAIWTPSANKYTEKRIKIL